MRAKSAGARTSRAPRATSPGAAVLPRDWTRRLIRNTLLWLVPVTAVWMLATPIYNRLLLRWGEGVLHLAEHPPVTTLPPKDAHEAYIERRDFPPAHELVMVFRVTDIHFPIVLLGALFLGVPGIPWRERLRNLGLALLATAVFDVILLFFDVKSCYATQLGAWSLAHYGPIARNVYGLGKHLLDLPFKLALPLLLWAAFYLPRLLAAQQEPRRARRD